MDDGLGARLAAARRAARKTQSGLAADVGTDVGTVSRYERGAIKPGIDALAAISRACGVTLDWLVTGEGEGPTEPESTATGTEG